MDIQRSLLIGAALLLSFMLLTEWVAFKDARENPVVVDSRLTASDDSAAPQVPSDLPSASPAPTPAARQARL